MISADTKLTTSISYYLNYLPKVTTTAAEVAAITFAGFGACVYLQNMTMAWSFLRFGIAVETVLASVLIYKRSSSDIDSSKAKREKLQKDFWTEFYKEKPLRAINLKSIFYILTLQKNYDLKEIITNIVNQYNIILNNSLDDEQKKTLLYCILLQIEKFPMQEISLLKKIHPDKIEPDFSHELLELPNSKVLITQFTLGDGSCGLHALLGKFKDGKCKADNIQELRSEFCEWIRSKKDNLPERIKWVLDDYFFFWNDLGISASFSALKTRTNNRIWHRLFSAYQSESDEDSREKIRQEFRVAILEDYLKKIEKVGTYLRQEELIAAAECFGKTLSLYQPDWKSRKPAGCTFNPGCADEVVIWYNGVNHYERAVILE